jgi:hypothetical protein
MLSALMASADSRRCWILDGLQFSTGCNPALVLHACSNYVPGQPRSMTNALPWLWGVKLVA